MVAPTNTAKRSGRRMALIPSVCACADKRLRAFRGAALTCHRHVIHSRAPASRPLDAIKGSLWGRSDAGADVMFFLFLLDLFLDGGDGLIFGLGDEALDRRLKESGIVTVKGDSFLLTVVGL